MSVIAASALAGSVRSQNRLATPGVVLIIAGVVLMYWGLGIFRGETSGATKRFMPGSRFGEDDKEVTTPESAGGSGSDSKFQ